MCNPGLLITVAKKARKTFTQNTEPKGQKMIEKLKARKRDDGFLEPATPSDIHWKINELVDAVNKIMTWRFETDDEPAENATISKMENVDPYAEQRKWIGKMCQFWDYAYEHDYFDTLKGITDDGLFIGHNGSWKHCKPIKSDDPIIYKGE